MGHQATRCNESYDKVESENPNTLTNEKTDKCVVFKDLSLNNLKFSALLDTECDLCLIRYDVLMMLGDVK